MMPYLQQQIQELASRVLERRLELKLTHAHVAERSKELGWPVSQPTQSKIETAATETLPGMAIIMGLALALETSPDRLLGFRTPEVVEAMQTLPADTRRVAGIMDRLPAELRAAVVRFAENAKAMADLREEQSQLYLNRQYLEGILSRVNDMHPLTRKAILDALRSEGVMENNHPQPMAAGGAGLNGPSRSTDLSAAW